MATATKGSAKGSAYSKIGSYNRNGVWLVGDGTGKGAVLRGDRLPAEGTGFQYYYLGSNPKQANPRIFPALGALQITTDQIPTDLTPAFQNGAMNLNFDTLPPIGISPKAYGSALSQAGSTAASATKDVFNALNFVFSLQFLYVIGGFALLLLALVMIAKKK